MALLTGALITGAIEGVKAIAGKYLDNKEQAVALAGELQTKVLGVLITELETKSSIIIAEAKGDSWLQRNWRPVTMLTFVILVVFRWMGWTDTTISEAVELQLMTLIQIGLGGYVVSRGIEKTAKIIAPAITARKPAPVERDPFAGLGGDL